MQVLQIYIHIECHRLYIIIFIADVMCYRNSLIYNVQYPPQQHKQNFSLFNDAEVHLLHFRSITFSYVLNLVFSVENCFRYIKYSAECYA